ncbi:exodeoxyribonuclease VII large subunit [Rhodovibrio salinarum]|uniref:Exodeoxyribonuclease 7 large subunit n=1 Tax=Rhodovibrio salinarum TaxID=1087 RepID=A0A934V1M0_9PROT|nr:exodeoxyribonuclease VII large subunit [Rhodovibrio salinarum]
MPFESDADPRGDNQPIFTVTELGQAVKKTVEGAFERVRVRGEISRPSFPASGHVYFRLKDENAVLDAVCFRGMKQKLAMLPEDGLEVIASGRLTTYAGKSSYQIIVDSLEMAGEGALLKLLEERKKKLAAEGLFAEERKRPLPYLPGVVGVITSPTGSVIRDILHRLADRFPRHVLVWPVSVQGEACAPQVTAAIQGFNALTKDGPVPRPDVLIVARGGGSLEDLWGFNEEAVVRAAAASEIPLISAVGHETDTTLIDFAADRRAPTPTAAAEIAVPVKSELVNLVADFERRLIGAATRSLENRRTHLEGLARGLPDPKRKLEESWQSLDDLSARLDGSGDRFLRQRRESADNLGLRLPTPTQRIAQVRERLDNLGERVATAGRRRIERVRDRFDGLDADRRLAQATDLTVRDARQRAEELGRLLEGYSYQATLQRGFAVVYADGQVATRAHEISAGQHLDITFADARVAAVAGPGDGPAPSSPAETSTPNQTQPVKKTAKPRGKPTESKPGGDGQGSLL